MGEKRVSQAHVKIFFSSTECVTLDNEDFSVRLFVYATVMRTNDVSKVSESTSTSSPVSEKFGIEIKRTVWPSGPSMTAVSNFGCEPTKNMCGQAFITKGSSSWNGYDPAIC